MPGTTVVLLQPGSQLILTVAHFYVGTTIRRHLLVVAQTVKRLSMMQETQVRSLGWEDPLEKEMEIHSSIPAWKKSHGQRSLVGYSPWGHKSWT